MGLVYNTKNGTYEYELANKILQKPTDSPKTLPKKKSKRNNVKVPSSKKQENINYFDDGYDFGDITRTGIQLGKNLVKTPENFKEGYDPGDVLKTIGASALDVGAGTVKGIMNFGESAIADPLQYGVAQVSDWMGFDKFANAVRENAKQNGVEQTFAPIDKLTNRYTAIGTTGDQLSSGIGNIIAMANGSGLLKAKGLPSSVNVGKFAMPVTSIASGIGSGMTEAYNNNASDGEAWAYGALSGLAEGFSESLFGGLGERFNLNVGEGGLDDFLIKRFTDKISNKTLRILAESGLKATGEGVEEILSGVGSAFAKNFTYLSEKDLKTLIKDENLTEQFIMGTLTSLISQTPGTIQSVKTGTDLITGQPTNNQAITLENMQENVPYTINNNKGNVIAPLGNNALNTPVLNQNNQPYNVLNDGKEYAPYVPIKGKETENKKSSFDNYNTEENAKGINLNQKDYNNTKDIIESYINENKVEVPVKQINENNYKAYKDIYKKTDKEVRNDLNNTIDNIYKKKMPKGNQVVLKTPPSNLLEYGVSENPMLMSPNGIRNSILTKDEAINLGYRVGEGDNYHSLGKDGFYEVLDNLDKPVMIIRENNKKIVVFTTKFDKNNNQVIVPVEINTESYYNDIRVNNSNVIKTSYGKTAINNYINNLEKKGAVVVFKDTKKIQELTDGRRVQYPESIMPVSANNITQEKQKVKSKEIRREIEEKPTSEKPNNPANNVMTMSEVKNMIDRVFNANGIYDFYDGKYKNADEWIKGEGIDDVSFYVENTEAIRDKFLYKLDRLYEDYTIEDILQAYVDGTLKIEKKAYQPKRLDLSKEQEIKDNRFYAPRSATNDDKLYSKALERVTNTNRQEVYKARADFIINAHEIGYLDKIGITAKQFIEKSKSWANYNKKAMDLSNSLNEGVASQNKWTGIENSSIVNTLSITDEQLNKMIKKIEGESQDYQRKYIVSTMLALDTHIDYKKLTFEFNKSKEINQNTASGKRTLGLYDNTIDTIKIGDGYQNTVAHEMGHYLDRQWGRELFGQNIELSDKRIISSKLDSLNPEQRQFVENFKGFIDDLENNSDIRSEYTMSSNEVFARFVARFVEWTKNQATNNRYGYENKYYKDNFTEGQYKEFVKLLQEKSYLDTTGQTLTNVKFNKKKSKTDISNSKYSIEETTNDQIQGLEDYTKPQIKNITTDYIKTALEYADVQADIVGMEIIGSRNRGTAKSNSDLDIVVELKGDNLREDDLFNLLNDDDEPLEINGIKVDINPIVAEKSGTLKEFMKRSKNYDKEHTKYLANEDNKGRTLSDEIIQKTKNSKARDEKGNLLSLYHGSPNVDITEFDINKSGQNTMSAEYGIYFTDSEKSADDFSYERIETDSMFFDKKGKKGKVYEAYLNLEKPLDFRKLSKQEISDLYEYASHLGQLDGKETFIENMTKWQQIGNHQLMKGNLDLKKLSNKYDGFIAKMDVKNNELEYVVFDPKQVFFADKNNESIKTNNIDNKGRTLTKEQQEYFKDSKVRDENGSLIEVYHRTYKGGFTKFNSKVNFFTNDPNADFYGDDKYNVYLNIKNPLIIEGNGKNYNNLEFNEDGVKQYKTTKIENAINNMDKITKSDVVAIAKAIDSNNSLEDYIDEFNSPKEALDSVVDAYTEGGTLEDFVKQYGSLNIYIDNGKIKTKNVTTTRDIAEYAKKKGYDGVIFKNIQDKTNGAADVYATLESPNQIKNVDNTTPTESDDIRYSIEEDTTNNKGYHWGDLGKGRDTYHWNMTSSRRSTGHFGTGTYFLGSKDGNVGSIKNGRQLHEVDFSKYNLFKPKNENEAYTLHEGLKALNYINNFNSDDFESLQLMLEKHGITRQKSYEAFVKARELYFSDEYQNASYDSELDSISTYFMKELGFNGIDVRGIEGFDNGTYGSVIYDLDNTVEEDNLLINTPKQDNKGRKLSKEQQEFYKNEDKKLLDKNGNLKTLYHGTPYNNFTTFKGKLFCFSEDYKFAKEYGETKSFDQGLDADIEVKEVYVKAENIFDPSNPKHIKKLSDNLSDDINYWGNIWDKETLLNKLQRKDTLPPKWKPEQIENKKFGDYIGDDRHGYNNDMFVGVNDNNEIVYISQERELNKLSQTEKDMFQKQLMDGKEVIYTTYQTIFGDLTEKGIQNKINELQKQKEEYKKENGVENEAIDYYIKNLKENLEWITKGILPSNNHKLIPRVATQETTELTDIDNWTYFETAMDNETRKDIVEIIQELGFDGINMYENGISNFAVFKPNQIKNVDNLNPTDSDDIRYSMIEDPIEISKLKKEDASTTPKAPYVKISDNTKRDGNSKHYSNLTEKSKFLNDKSVNAISNETGVKYYDTMTNQEVLKQAKKELDNGGSKETLKWFAKEPTHATPSDIAKGWILLKQYQDKGDYDSVVQVAKKMRLMGTTTGRTLQMYAIMERLTPQGMVKYAQAELSEAFEEMVKNKSKAWIDKYKSDFELTPAETKFIMDTMLEVSKMKDGYEKNVKLAEIQKLMTDKLPPEKGAGIKAWMRISMLFNPKTQVRNVLGNTVIAPVNAVSDVFASGIDKMVSKKTGVRTTGSINLNSYTSGFKQGLYESYNDFKKGINTRNVEGNRFEIGEGKSFNDKTLIGHKLNQVDNLLSFMLDAGDRGFYEAAFTNSINNQMILNNTKTVTPEMIDIATTEALQRTWQDNNEYTRFVLNTRKGLNKLMSIGNYGLGDILIPFAKTPANLTKAIVDYSPVGLVHSLVEGHNLKNAIETGQFTAQQQHKFVQDLGKAVAGTMLYVIGYALANAGAISGKNDEDKDTANFMKNTLGVSPYSIKIGNKTFTYDWAQPVAAPFAIMSDFMSSNDEDASILEKSISAFNTGFNIVVEQSFMQSIKTVLDNKDGIATGIQEAIMELPSRAIPTLSKQIVDLTDGTQRQTFVYGKPLETAKNKVLAKIPGTSKALAPTVDTMGREIKKYGGKNNIFNVFFNPANVNNENISKSAGEIYRLYQETGRTDLMPRVSPYYINHKGEKIVLSNEDKSRFQKISGDIIEQNVQKIMKSSQYQYLSDEEKADIIQDIVNYSYNKARFDVLGIEMSDTYQSVADYEDVGGNLSDYYLFQSSINNENSETKKQSISNFLIESNLSDKEISYLYNKYYSSDKTMNMLSSFNIPIKEYIKLNLQSFESDYNQNGKAISGSKQAKMFNYINSLKLNATQKAILMKMQYKSFKKYDKQILNYINNMNATRFEKASYAKQIGFDYYDDYLINYILKQNTSNEEKINQLKNLGFRYINGKIYK